MLKIIHTKNLRWIDIVNPDEKDLNYLKENFRFHPLDFEDIVLPSTRTRIDEYDSYHFILLLLPILNKQTGEIKPVEVDFFIGKDFVITIHDGSMQTLNNIVHSVHQYDNSRAQHMGSTPGFLLYSILEILFKRSAPILDRINHQMQEASKNIFQADLNTLEALLQLKKNIITYRRIVRMHTHILNKVARSNKDYLKFKESKAFFQDLIEYAENIWNVLSSDKESVESFEETNQSLGTHKINKILHVLTVLSVMISVLALLTDILVFFERSHLASYGLDSNFKLLIFFVTLVFLTTTLMLYYFRKKKWL